MIALLQGASGKYLECSNQLLLEKGKSFVPTEKPVLEFSDILESMQTNIKIRIHKAAMNIIVEQAASATYDAQMTTSFSPIDFPLKNM